MTTVKTAINGMGRIGRTILREVFNKNLQDQFQIKAINNPGTPEQYIHLLKYDSLHGPFNADVSYSDGILTINNTKIKFHSVRNPSDIPWSEDDIQVVIDATGKFKDKESLSQHLGGSVKKVIMCAPGKDLDGTFVVGINHEEYNADSHNVISNASCTTNCLAPVAKVLHEKFGIVSGLMTTIHSYTSDQQLLDGSHRDPRRSRAAAMNMIPTSTGAAKALGLVIPSLSGKLDGFAVRVPTPNVSMVDLTVHLEKSATADEVNAALKAASENELKGVLKYTEEQLVSCDFMGMRESSCVDATLTNVMGDGNNLKVIAWYDNEAGFSNRVIDLAQYVGERL
jgi:glyceraldehyde-3-phosphate dehydrogenase type I